MMRGLEWDYALAAGRYRVYIVPLLAGLPDGNHTWGTERHALVSRCHQLRAGWRRKPYFTAHQEPTGL